jgi:glycosyltransferase involved in cell wall biosynthesis
VAVPIVMATESVAFGGVEMALLQIVERLDPQEFEISVFLPRDEALGSLVERLRQAGSAVVEAPRKYGKYDPLFALALRNHIRARRAPLVHLHQSHIYGFEHVVALLRASGVPVILATEQNGPYEAPRLERARRLLKRWNCRMLDGTFVVSVALQRLLVEEFGAAPRDVWLLGNSVDTHRFHAGIDALEARRELGAPEDVPVFFTAARLEHQKGLEYLIRAAAILLRDFPAGRFWIAGTGSLRESLQSLAQSCGVSHAVTFLGFRSDLPSLIAASNVFVLPSLYEGLPLTILEAMATGRPVVATRVGGTPDVVHDGQTGLLVEPADVEGLAAAMSRLLREPALARTMATQGAVLARDGYGIDAAVASIAGRYRSALAKKGIRA